MQASTSLRCNLGLRGRFLLGVCAAGGSRTRGSNQNASGGGSSGDAAAARSSLRDGRNSSTSSNNRSPSSRNNVRDNIRSPGGRDGTSRNMGSRGRGRGQGKAWRTGRRTRRSNDDEDEDADGNAAVDDGFIIIGRAERPASAQEQGAMAAMSLMTSSPSSSSTQSGDTAALDPLDGSRFWIEASGIDDLDDDEEEEEEEEAEEREGEIGGDDDNDGPSSPEELLENMQRQGFSLRGEEEEETSQPAAGSGGGSTTTATITATTTGRAAPAVAAHDTAAPADLLGQPRAAASPDAAAAMALRDLRDTFIATSKPPVLPPWFLGPVEVGGNPAGKRPKGGGATAATAAVGPRGRGGALRTTQAVAPGELLAVSLPLAICYCRQGTTPENEDLADAMLSVAAGKGADGRGGEVSTAGAPAMESLGLNPASKLPSAHRNRTLAITCSFSGLTDLQQSLLGCLWRGHDVPGTSDKVLRLQPTEEDIDTSDTAAIAVASVLSARPGGGSSAGTTTVGPVRRPLLEMVARSAADGSLPRSPPLLSAPELYRLVNLNCLGEDFQDLALCELRGELPRGHIALWPEAAFTGHSCSPNATAYTVGDRLVVRASTEIPKGAEVSLNWLGSLVTAPSEVRTRELRQQYGFTCGCVRCTAEARYSGTPLAALLETTYATCQELSPALDRAIAAGDMAEVEATYSRLQGMQAEVETAIRTASPKVNSKTRRWLQACVYDMYDMISLCADELAAAAALSKLMAEMPGKDTVTSGLEGAPGQLGGRGPRAGTRHSHPHPRPPVDPVETESLAQCARILDGVSPGSDGHVYLAAELAMRSLQLFGPQHEEYRQARAALVRAYGIRYGNVGPEVMELLVAARLAAEAREEEGEEMGEEGPAGK